MRGSRLSARLTCVAVVASLATACTTEAEPVHQRTPQPQAVVTQYDPSLEASAAVLALVPEAATRLTVTDFDQLRLVLGLVSLDGSSPASERAAFRRKAARTAALSTGLLRPQEGRLLADFGFTQDDVIWEATYGGGADGWVLAFRDDLPMSGVTRAVQAGVGPLAGAVIDTDQHLVTSAPVPAPEQSWGADPDLVGLGGREAISTYFERGCLDFDEIYGAGMAEELAAAPAGALRSLDPLDFFAVALGTELVTVLLGPQRSDAFERGRLASVMPRTDPDFEATLTRPVADPSSGRLGYVLSDPRAAAKLTRERTLPFAVCRPVVG